MSRVLIIGYGNPLRRDDGFGWHVAHRLQQELREADVEIIACHQLTPELAEPLSRARYAIFVDIAVDCPRGELSVKTIPTGVNGQKFSHHVTARSLLADTRLWYGTSPRTAYMISARARDLQFGEQLSTEMTQLVPLAVREAKWLCSATRTPAAVV